MTTERWRFLLPGRAGARGGGAGVEAREELLDAALPLTPLRAGVGTGAGTGAGAAGRFAPHEVTGRTGDFTLPSVGKSPSERILGGLLGFRPCRFEDDSVDVSGVLSASS
jgi:hypothetical protein